MLIFGPPLDIVLIVNAI